MHRVGALVIAFVFAGCTLGGNGHGGNNDDDDDSPSGSAGSDGTGGSVSDSGGDTAAMITCTDVTGISGIAKVIECVPAGMDGKTATPAALVVALHGYTQTAAEFRDTTEWHKLAA